MDMGTAVSPRLDELQAPTVQITISNISAAD